MIQKVIYEETEGRKRLLAEACCLITFFGGGGSRGQQQGSASYPLPLQVLSCGSCCWRGNSCSQWETRTGSRKSS